MNGKRALGRAVRVCGGGVVHYFCSLSRFDFPFTPFQLHAFIIPNQSQSALRQQLYVFYLFHIIL